MDFFFETAAKKNVFFVEIGANDGINADPLYQFIKKYNLSGVYVEPQKKVFARLVDNFPAETNKFFENIAITETEAEVTLHIPLDNNSDPDDTSLMASILSPDQIHFFNTVEKEVVPGKPISYLVEKYELDKKKNVLLLIDVEGYEKQIIFSIDFNTFSPAYIFFEHAHLTYQMHNIINKHLTVCGYKIYLSKFDTLAYKE